MSSADDALSMIDLALARLMSSLSEIGSSALGFVNSWRWPISADFG
jgi:hypothetical protein